MKKRLLSRNSECPEYEMCLAKVAFKPYGYGRFNCNGCKNENVHRDPLTLGWREVFGCIKLLHTIFRTDYVKYGPRDKYQSEDEIEVEIEDAIIDHIEPKHIGEFVDHFGDDLDCYSLDADDAIF